MTLSQSALSELLEAIRAGGGIDLAREAYAPRRPGAHRARGRRRSSARPATSAPTSARPTATAAAAGCSRPRPATSSCTSPSSARAASSRPCSSPAGASTRRSGRSSWRPTSTACRRARSTTSWPPWASRRASARARSAASAPSSTRSWPPSGSGPSTMSASPTSSSTPPTSRPTQGPSVVSKAIVVATGVTEHGEREVLGPRGGRQRGRRLLDGLPALAAGPRPRRACGSSISDAHEGLKGAIAAVLLGSAWQRCRVHFLRNVLARVPQGLGAEMVLAAIRTIFAQPDAAPCREQLDEVVDKLDAALPGGGRDARRCPRGPARLPRLPGRPLAQDLEHQPARAGQQGDQAPHRRGGHLPQRGRRHCGSRGPCCSSSTTSGRWPSGATSPRARWRSLTGSPMMMATKEVDGARALLLAS